LDVAALLVDFAAANDAAAATTKKLQKQRVLGEYLRGIEDEADLRLAVRFALGRAFATSSEETLNVGWATVSRVVLELLKVDASVFHAQTVKSGEIGEALSVFWDQTPHVHAGLPPLTLREMSEGFEELCHTGSTEQKEQILRELFVRCAQGREATYLAKIIFRDMRTGVQEGVLQASIAEAFGRPLKEVQRCQLLLGDLDEVAVLARRDALHEARFRLFHPIQFMLATAQETADEAAGTLAGRTFYAEEKLDGIRAQVHKQGERIVIYSRTMDQSQESFPDVVEQVKRWPGEFLLDGEIVPFRDGQVLPFAHIQRRLGRKELTPKILRDNPCVFIAFDLLYQDGDLLLDVPLRDRRRRLETLCGTCASVEGGQVGATQVSPSTGGEPRATQGSPLRTGIREVTSAEDIERAFAMSREARNEGLVLKDPESSYSPGRRGKAWLKLKTHLPTLDCVVTAAEIGHGKRRNSLSDYTFAVWDRDPAEPGAALVNVGKAYIGVTDAEIEQLTRTFTELTTHDYGRVKAVQPKIVLEIACDQIQKSTRHASGYALRFPRIARIRWDKPPEQADRLERVIELYNSTANFARSQHDPTAEPAEPTLFD
jgi:DNA ligase 1